MLSRIRRLLPLKFRKKILGSFVYRGYLRYLATVKKEIRFNVEITTNCNIKCEMCTRADMLKEGKLIVKEIDEIVIDKVIIEMKRFEKLGYKVIFAPMGLGEPLLYSSFEKTLKKIRQESDKIKIVLVTNGLCLNEKIIKSLIKLKVDEISVSLNANNRVEYKEHMGVDAYLKVKENINKLIKIRNESGFKLPSIYIQYLDYYNNENKFEKDMMSWRKKMKYGDKSYVHQIVNLGGFKKNKADNLKISDFPCNSPLSQVAIKVNGDIYPCCSCFYGGTQKIEELFLGNIKNTSLVKMFTNKKSKNFKIVEMMENNDYSKIPICKKCNNYKLGVNYFFRNPLTKKWW
ncbi:MAG: radical SAM protein [Candidatus Shapirobacteria bacterium]